MNYKVMSYRNFKELKQEEPELTKNMLKRINKGEWMNEELFVYPTIEDFVIYELTDGWYYNYDFDGDYNGAPNPLDFIDIAAFGKTLMKTWDDECNIEIDKQIITTAEGWKLL